MKIVFLDGFFNLIGNIAPYEKFILVLIYNYKCDNNSSFVTRNSSLINRLCYTNDKWVTNEGANAQN